ncbi:glycosyltransferase family 8 protein [Sedimentibacter sp. MB31-C6]|uniref:glycosyltransferase family 8 protein n=1 Tax=Sedimentibacter sp. MB31-C6 TaxID=3109366 RepID=UPI002DDCD57A|nr:glycosyltransferase family 8 protein [Sedimentibacter sp. MB36-C1]WSI03180.1 glycosyltransferase family 8 protein [Sedimentibacter sp. MB36-C1]
MFIKISKQKESRTKLNLLFSIDKKFVSLLIGCLKSIDRFQSPQPYNVYILNSDLTKKDIEEIKNTISSNMVVHNIYVDPNLFNDFPVTSRYPQQIYYRILAASLLPKELDRILYLDVDTVVINPLDNLYNMKFEGAYYIACTHVKSFFNKMNCIRLGIREQKTYINSGIMLMNLKALREHQNANDIVVFVQENWAKLFLPDQDIISALYGEKIKLVDSRIYNLSDRILSLHNATPPYNERLDVNWVRDNSVVIHYCGRNKPWNKKYIGVLDVFYHELNQHDVNLENEI